MSGASQFGWYELMTPDVAAAKAFYGKVVGWTTKTSEHGPYEMWTAPGGTLVGGLMGLTDEMKAQGIPPHWLGYVGVSDIVATSDKVRELGGKFLRPPADLPDGAQFAIIADPTGAALGLYQPPPTSTDGPPHRGLGGFSWHELMSSDPEAAFAFYAGLFGWQKKDAMPMGEAGVYQLFATADGTEHGGMMRLPEGMPVSAWGFYATVADADVAAATIKEAGGTIMHGPVEVPGGGKIVMYADSQGVVAAVFAPAAT